MPQFRISKEGDDYDLHLPYDLKKVPFWYEPIWSSTLVTIQDHELAEIIEARISNNRKRVNELLSRFHNL